MNPHEPWCPRAAWLRRLRVQDWRSLAVAIVLRDGPACECEHSPVPSTAPEAS